MQLVIINRKMFVRFNAVVIKIVLVGLALCFVLSLLAGLFTLTSDRCMCKECEAPIVHISHHVVNNSPYSSKKRPRLAVLVPFRERFEELIQFVPHMHKFLMKQDINYEIFILHQVDRFRFNRASLINVGFILTKNEFDYIAMHDVDLLPLNDNLKYVYPTDGPLHIASPDYHPKYHYPTFVGGILLIKREHFETLNGMSNMYWGWGLEDDEFYLRIREARLPIFRPKNITTGTENTFRHIHDRAHRKRDTAKCFNQKEVTRKRDRKTGLSTVMYKMKAVNNMVIDTIPFTLANIVLVCNFEITPWCDCANREN